MQYISHIHWQNQSELFDPKSYDRTHEIRFNGGTTIKASSAAEYLGKAELPNPEELFAAAISSCFMLTFLYLAAMKKIMIEAYEAEAIALLGKNTEGKMAVTKLTLKPRVRFKDTTSDASVLKELFKKAHEQCFISNSVNTQITIESEQTAMA